MCWTARRYSDCSDAGMVLFSARPRREFLTTLATAFCASFSRDAVFFGVVGVVGSAAGAIPIPNPTVFFLSLISAPSSPFLAAEGVGSSPTTTVARFSFFFCLSEILRSFFTLADRRRASVLALLASSALSMIRFLIFSIFFCSSRLAKSIFSSISSMSNPVTDAISSTSSSDCSSSSSDSSSSSSSFFFFAGAGLLMSSCKKDPRSPGAKPAKPPLPPPCGPAIVMRRILADGMVFDALSLGDVTSCFRMRLVKRSSLLFISSLSWSTSSELGGGGATRLPAGACGTPPPSCSLCSCSSSLRMVSFCWAMTDCSGDTKLV
mmetsp:Transcript_15491/g.36907  ORF Transcript_15491/g.36907 Transcript_15491/m.36907 type:complete len:321 (-) Transcript_15491:1453-2415(-)